MSDRDQPTSRVTPDPPAPARIDAAEAAARLGVKRATLYAYVSRGLLESRTAPDGKTSTFDPAEVDAVRARGATRRRAQVDTPIVSSITAIGDHRIHLRGHDLVALARSGASLEQVAELAWRGELDPAASWPSDPDLGARARQLAGALGASAPMIERLRVAVAAASAGDPLRHDRRPTGVCAAGRRIADAMVHAVATRAPGGALPGGAPPGGAAPTVAGRLWAALADEPPTPGGVAALDAALVVLVDHDLAPSTFAARLAASTRADPYSVAAAGLGVLGGSLHGAASRPLHEALERAWRGEPDAAVADLVGGEGPVAGFGHPAYPDGDPRAGVLLDALADVADPDRRATLDQLLGAIRARTGVAPNVDAGLAALSFAARLPAETGEVIFAVARSAGWLAHALEEYGERPLRFRPSARHVQGRPAGAPSGPR